MTDTSAPFIDFGDEEDEEEADLDEIKRKQDEEFDFSGALQRVASDSQKKTTGKGIVVTSHRSFCAEIIDSVFILLFRVFVQINQFTALK